MPVIRIGVKNDPENESRGKTQLSRQTRSASQDQVCQGKQYVEFCSLRVNPKVRFTFW